MKIHTILAVSALVGIAFWPTLPDSAIAETADGSKPPIAGTRDTKARFTQVGLASFYSQRQRTASGAEAQLRTMTAAHPRLPFGSRVRVKHLKSGKEILVTITDRGPFRKGRIIDVSTDAAKALGMTDEGVARVRITLDD